MVITPNATSIWSLLDTKVIVSIVGSFVYYKQVVNQTVLVDLSEIGRQQSKPTLQTKEKATILLDYLSTHQMMFYASMEVIHIYILTHMLHIWSPQVQKNASKVIST